jgi:hypothetical protein
MKAQKCRLCGAHHHRWEPHQFADVPEPSAEEAAAANEFFANMPRNILIVSAPEALADEDEPSQTSPPIVGDQEPSDTPKAIVSPSAAEPPVSPRAKFDRNAYQREYMKKWRKNRKP